MADKKISQLTSSSIPLAGTEVLPIVQSGATVKVAVSDLTAGRAVSMLSANVGNASGQNSVFDAVVGSAAATTGDNSGVVIVTNSTGKGWIGFNNANNASIPGQVTYNHNTNVLDMYTSGTFSFTNGNVTVATAAKGINFTANTGAAGMTSQLLNWYEEGTWTVGLTTAGGNFTALTIADSNGTYARVGRQVTVTGYFYTLGSITGGSGQVYITGLPFSAASTCIGNVWVNPDTVNYNSPSALPVGVTTSGTQLRLFKNGTTNNPVFSSTELSTSGYGNYIAFTCTYFV
jgi:hypothetical protein